MTLQAVASSSEFQANPYSFFNRIREETSAYPVENMAITHFITRYEDCDRLFRDKDHFGRGTHHLTDDEIAALPKPPDDAQHVVDIQKNWLLFMSPPEHTRVRSLIHKAFTPKVVRSLRHRAETLADHLLCDVKKRGEFELMSDFALRLPLAIIADMLGVPVDDHTQFREWAHHVLGTLDIVPRTPEYRQKTLDTYQAVSDYMTDLITKKRQKPDVDLLSNLIQVEEAGDTLSEDELIATAIMLLIAGFDTTTNLIGNGIHALMTHPEQWEMLIDNPDLVSSAVDECLRYNSPVCAIGRNVLKDIEFAGVELKRGTKVMSLIASANHDPRQFTNPDTFDITRNEGRALSFGGGIHHCLGAPLACMEADVAFRAMLHHVPNLRLATPDTATWRVGFLMRGLEKMYLTF